jgi:hypothetical protein
MAHHAAGAVAHANEEAVRAWDTVLYERWKKNRKVFVGARTASRRSYSSVSRHLEGGRCIDIVENAEFETSDAQTAEWQQIYDYAFSRMGTQFFAMPVQAMRAIRRSLVPGGALAKICWRRKAESAM